MPVAHGANPALDPDGFDLRMVPSAINWIFLSSLQILPPITSQIVTLAPLPTMKRFKDEGTTGNATPLPFSAMLVGGVIWCMYGRLTDDMTIMIPNVRALPSSNFLSAFFVSLLLPIKPRVVPPQTM